MRILWPLQGRGRLSIPLPTNHLIECNVLVGEVQHAHPHRSDRHPAWHQDHRERGRAGWLARLNQTMIGKVRLEAPSTNTVAIAFSPLIRTNGAITL